MSRSFTVFAAIAFVVVAIACVPIVAVGTEIENNSAVISASGDSTVASRSDEPNRAKAYLAAKRAASTKAIASLMEKACASINCRMGSSQTDISRQIDEIISAIKIVSERTWETNGDTLMEVVVEAGMPIVDVLPIDFGKPELTITKATVSLKTPEIARTGDEPYTSVIINTIGLHVKRSMAPKIYREDGSEVWGTLKVDIDYVEDHGIVAYARSMSDAYANPRAGSNPMVIRAIERGDSPYGGDAVVSDEDARYILDENQSTGFLDKFNVIFVIDPSKF